MGHTGDARLGGIEGEVVRKREEMREGYGGKWILEKNCNSRILRDNGLISQSICEHPNRSKGISNKVSEESCCSNYTIF